jgi:hypothetical protein
METVMFKLHCHTVSSRPLVFLALLIYCIILYCVQVAAQQHQVEVTKHYDPLACEPSESAPNSRRELITSSRPPIVARPVPAF